MIYYLVTPRFEHTIKNYLAYWAKDLEPRFQIRFYDDVLRARELPLGTYVFSDLERLMPAETEIATRVWEQLNAAGAKLLNHPKRTLKRYDLLTMLHEKVSSSLKSGLSFGRLRSIRKPCGSDFAATWLLDGARRKCSIVLPMCGGGWVLLRLISRRAGLKNNWERAGSRLRPIPTTYIAGRDENARWCCTLTVRKSSCNSAAPFLGSSCPAGRRWASRYSRMGS